MKILIAEENKLLCAAIKKILAISYPTVVTEEAVNGTDSLIKSLKRGRRWNLIITSDTNPVLTAIELAEEQEKMQPVNLLLIGAIEEAAWMQSKFSHFQGYISKTGLQYQLPYAVSAIMQGRKYFKPTIKETNVYKLKERLSIAS
jgi:DNA-binding NarL/FixJ family response regulator